MILINNIKYLLYSVAFIMPVNMVCAQQFSAEEAKLIYTND